MSPTHLRSSRIRRRRDDWEATRRFSSQATTLQPPGTPVFVGRRRRDQADLQLIRYDAGQLQDKPQATLADCCPRPEEGCVTWLNVSGVHDVELIGAIGEAFGLHPMTREDIANTSQRPKWEQFPDYGFAAMKMLAIDETIQEVKIEHVSLIVGRTWVLSFLEDEGDVFATVRARIRSSSGRVRSLGADYLAYCLIDAVVDHYFLAVEWIGDRIEIFDDHVINSPDQVQIQEIHHFKRGLLALRRAVWPMREVVGAIGKCEAGVIRADTTVFWRDVYDHTVQVIDMVETCRDILASLHDTYLSALSNRMNEVMKTLTIISTIFIPLTFIAGVYGMNFKVMPELEWPYGYYAVLVAMLTIAVLLVLWFGRRRWL
jgi:magnesium transporter